MASKPPEDDDDLPEIEIEEDELPEIEVEDDTPPEDQGRTPMPKEVVDEFENDDLEEYSEKVKIRLKQAKKLVHDERREKERALREHNEAMETAKRYFEENRRLKSTLSQGEGTLLASFKQQADYEAQMARKAYKEAYEEGDTDKVLEAQEKLNLANFRQSQLSTYTPTLQEDQPGVDTPEQAAQPPRPDDRTLAWQERNPWYGTDAEMTASALGLHQKLITERGVQFAGTDEYWKLVDKTIRRRFPENFSDEAPAPEPEPRPARKQANGGTVVASASRTRGPKKVVLRASQLALARKFGLTPEQCAKEVLKLEQKQ